MSAICYGRRDLIGTVLAGAVLAVVAIPSAATAGEKPAATLYKDPQCGCCEDYAAYLRQHGYQVTVKPTHDLSLINRRHGVPQDFEGCHTTLIDGYVVGGHVPVKVIDRLLAERPDIKGISLPGMPQGSPGMTGTKTEPFTIYAFSTVAPRVYAVE